MRSQSYLNTAPYTPLFSSSNFLLSFFSRRCSSVSLRSAFIFSCVCFLMATSRRTRASTLVGSWMASEVRTFIKLASRTKDKWSEVGDTQKERCYHLLEGQRVISPSESCLVCPAILAFFSASSSSFV